MTSAVSAHRRIHKTQPMPDTGLILGLLAAVAIMAAIGRRIGLAGPIVFALGGVPWPSCRASPASRCPPSLVLVVFLPPSKRATREPVPRRSSSSTSWLTSSGRNSNASRIVGSSTIFLREGFRSSRPAADAQPRRASWRDRRPVRLARCPTVPSTRLVTHVPRRRHSCPHRGDRARGHRDERLGAAFSPVTWSTWMR